MDRARSLALAAIPLIALGLYFARDRKPPAPAPPPAEAPLEPKGLGPLAGAMAERGEAALAPPKPSAVPNAPPPEAVAATNLPLANDPARPKRTHAPAPRGACAGVEVRLITDSDDPAWAFASLSPAAGERAVIRRVGERIGDMRVTKIEWDRVWLAGAGGRCAASMHFGVRDAAEADDLEPTKKKRRRGLPDDAPRGQAPWRLSGEMVNGIEKLGETTYAVDKALVPAIFEQAGSLLAGLKIEPVKKDEEVVGFELGEVRTDSLLERLGVETGDRVLAIDEAPAKDLAAIMKALSEAREKDQLIARLERQGERFELKVSVR